MAGNKIQLKRTSVTSRVPSTSDIDVGELAINLADNRLFTKNGSNAIIDVHGQSLNTTANVSFTQVNSTNVVTSQVDGTGSLVLNQSGAGGFVVIKNNSNETVFLPSGAIRPSGPVFGSSYDSNQLDPTQLGPLQLKGMLYGVSITASPDNGATSYAWNFGTDGNLSAPKNITANGTITANTFVGNVDWSYVQSKPDLKIDITGDATGNATFSDLANGSINVALSNTTVVVGTYGNSSAIPVITVDSKGRITSATTNTVAGVTGYSYTTSNNTFTITAGDGSTYSATISTVNTFAVSNTLQVTGTSQFSNDVTITGNLIVTGTTTYVNTNVFQISDEIITLNADHAGTPTANVGFEINRGTSANTYLIWNEGTDKWSLSNDGTTYLTIATNNDVSTAYSNAASYADTKAGQAYTNAVAYAASNSYVNTTFAPLAGATFTGPVLFNANVTLGSTVLLANGASGTAGQVLTSGGSGSNVYWSTVTSGGGGGTGNTFSTIQVSGQSDVVADDPADALTLVGGNNVTITTNAGTDTITFAANNTLFTLTTASNTSSANISLTGTGLTANTIKVIGAGGVNVNSNGSVITIDGTNVSGGGGGGSTNSFGTIAVSGQTDVIADQANDTLTFVAGSGMSITTNPSGDTITFTSTGGGGGGGSGIGNAFISGRDNFTGDGTITAFTLSQSVTSNNILVAVDGLIQFYNEDYEVAGTSLTFTSAPANNELVEVIYISGASTYQFSQYAAVDTFAGNGSNTQYTLTRSANTSTAQVYLDGLLQAPSTDYSISGSTLTFTTAPLTDEAVIVYHTETTAGNPHLTSIAGTDTFAGDDVETNFTLSATANSSTSFVTVNGLVQRYTTDYTVSGTTLSFITAPPDGATVQAWRLTGSLGVTFKTVSVSGQSDIVADQADDTLTFANGAGITITTNASTDTLTIARSAITKQSLTGNGSNTIFTLSTSTTEDDLLVFVDGIYFHPTDDYSVSGTTLTFTTAPINSAEIRIRYIR